MKYIFVYGTLKIGGSNHSLLGDARFVGRLELDDYYMFTNGYFPYILHKRDVPVVILQDAYNKVGDFKSSVLGEVYEVSDATLKRIRQLEGVPTHYTTKELDFTIERWDSSHSVKTFEQGTAEFYVPAQPKMAYSQRFVLSGYFNADRNSNVVWSVVVDEQRISGNAPDIVRAIRSRAFDTEAKTMAEYMQAVNNRLQAMGKSDKIPFEDEGHFLNFLASKSILAEWKDPKNIRNLNYA